MKNNRRKGSHSPKLTGPWINDPAKGTRVGYFLKGQTSQVANSWMIFAVPERYRTMRIAPQPDFRRMLEEIRDLRLAA